MAAKVKLDLDATDNLDFERTVQLPDPAGKKAIFVTFTYRYRDRLGMADFFDAIIVRTKAEDEKALAARAELEAIVNRAEAGVRQAVADALDGDDFVLGPDIALNISRMLVPKRREPIAAQVKESLRHEVDAIMGMVAGWNIDGFEFDEANVSKLLTRFPGAYRAISDDYYQSVSQGRLGNSVR